MAAKFDSGMTSRHYLDSFQKVNHKKYSDEIWNHIRKSIEQVRGQHAVAVFDADGTLWETDMGEMFFHEQIEAGFLHTLEKDPWKYYCEKKRAGQTREAYMWLAQILAGYPLAEVRAFAERSFQKKRSAAIAAEGEFIFQSQRELIDTFRANDIDVYVVTASIKWAVEPGARVLGIPETHVLGIETEIDHGIVTDRGIYPITYREGKASRLLDACRKKPFFACGNTMGDFALLDSATHVKLAVRSHSSEGHLCETEEELYQEAVRLNWLLHTF